MSDTTNTRCPLCGGENQCAMARGAADASGCWCSKTPVPMALRMRVAAERGGACICRTCVEAPVADPEWPTLTTVALARLARARQDR